MKTSRREFIALAGAAGALTGCNVIARRLPGNGLPDSVALPAHGVRPAARLLNRAGFGPRPGEVAAVEGQGAAAWVDAQLACDDSESPRLNVQLARLDVWQEDDMDLLDLHREDVVSQLNQAELLRAVYGKWQLKERMSAFWADHFNVYSQKDLAAFGLGNFEHTTIRANALGTLPALLQAVAKSPVMLAYLDNEHNVRGVPNENYARELMELHTLGVHGGYTQKDVQEVARCFTGWTYEQRMLHRKGAFRFDASLHDKGAKVVLGHRIPAGGGQQDAETVLDIVAHHPSTASFISGKLCRHFLGDTHHPMRKELAATFTRTGGDIKALVRPLFLSSALLKGPPIAKRPIDFVASALRATAADTDCGPGIQDHLARMGQTLYAWPMPDGYPDRATAWTGSLLARWNFALALAHGHIGGTGVDLDELVKRSGSASPDVALNEVLLNRKAEPATPLLHAPSTPQIAALCLASPDFQLR
ncbi:MAG: DUF1800 domain-containing protein [Fimbriimonadaceae bacterium]